VRQSLGLSTPTGERPAVGGADKNPRTAVSSSPWRWPVATQRGVRANAIEDMSSSTTPTGPRGGGVGALPTPARKRGDHGRPAAAMTNRPPALDPFHEACHWGAFSLGLKPSAVLLPCRPRPCRGGRPADGRPPPRLHAAAAVESGAGKKTRTHKDKLLTAWMRDRRSPCASALCAHEPQLSRVKRQSLGQRHCAGESARRRGQIKFISAPFCHRRPRASSGKWGAY